MAGTGVIENSLPLQRFIALNFYHSGGLTPMSEELLSYENYDYNKIHMFVATKGLSNVTVQDLDRIIEKYGKSVLGIVDFFNLYNIVSTNDANRTMKKWTIRTGVMTIIVTISTVINLILFASTL